MYSKALSLLLISGRISVTEMLTFLTEKKLLSLLPEIHKELTLRSEEEKAKETLLLETPFELSAASIATIQKLLSVPETSPVKIRERKDLLSGFKATYHHLCYDGSARKIINNLIK